MSIYSSILARNSVFFDDMESGAANWAHDAIPSSDTEMDTWALTITGPPPPSYYGPPYTYSGTWSFTDSPFDPIENEWDYESEAESWLGLFNPLDLYTRFGTKLTFWARYDLGPTIPEPGDFLWIEGASQHGPWFNYGGLYGSTLGGFEEIEIDLSAHDNIPDLLVRFRLETDSATEDDGVYIDDVEIATHVPGDAYDYFEGTSMAAPHVSGLAGLIMAAFPGISNDELKTRILNGVDPKPGLVGMTVSGGRINAMRSLGLPIASSGLTGQAPSANQVNLRWVDNSGFPVAAWTEEDGFSVYRKTEGGGAYTLVGTAAGVPGVGNTISFTDSSASPGQLYIYLVKAYNWYGESESTNEFTVITPGGNFGSIDSNPNAACFIATAAYGSPPGRSIDLLRAFRNEYLLAHPIGKRWIDLYYRYSPILAEFIADRPAMRKGVRLILSPFVAFSAVMVETTAFQKGSIFCFIVGFLLVMALLSKGRKAKKRVSSIHTS